MSETYTPVYTDATRDAYAGKSGQDPRAYTTDVARRVDFKYTLNPLYNETLNLIRGSVADGTYRKTWTCLAGLNVGDPVYVSATDTVSLALATTAATSRVIGFVRYKPTTTTCYIDHFILKTGLSGLTAGSPVYLSDAGGFAATAGTISKVLGIATDTDEAVVEADQGGAEVGALSGTTANAFTIDSDSVTGKIIIDVALGAADKSLTLTNVALTDNRIVTFQNASGTVALTGDAPTAHAASHITGGGDTIASAVAGGAAGLMTGADKTRLDGIETGADVTDAANVLAALSEPAADIVINEDGHDHDFRIESDTLTHAFFVQGSDGYVGIGGVPSTNLDVKGSAFIGGTFQPSNDTARLNIRSATDADFDALNISIADGSSTTKIRGIYQAGYGTGLQFLTGVGAANTALFLSANSGMVGLGCTPRYKFEVSTASGYNFLVASSSSVAHGVTGVLPTDAFYGHQLHSSLGNTLYYLSGGDFYPFLGYAVFGTDNPTDTTAAWEFVCGKKDGAGIQALSATETCFQIQNVGTNLVTVLGSGYVGIGRTPTVRLDVDGTLQVGSTTASYTSPQLTSQSYYNAGIKLINTKTDNAGVRNWAISGRETYGDFGIWQSSALGGDPMSAGVCRFSISETGGVSIDKDSTYSAESASGLYLRSGSGATNTGLILGADKTNNIAYIQSIEPATSWSTKSLALNPNGGYVGVGQTPNYPLDVKLTQNFVAFGGDDNVSGHVTGIRLGYNPSGNLYNKAAIIWEAIGDANARGKLHIALDVAADNGNAAVSDAVMTFYNGNVGVGEPAPGTLFDMASTAPYLTIHNTTEEDGAGGREGKLIFEGEQSGGELTTLGEIEFSHDGTSDDEKGKFILRLNDGSDGTSPTDVITALSNGSVGIGQTTDLGYKLEVGGGNIRVRGAGQTVLRQLDTNTISWSLGVSQTGMTAGVWSLYDENAGANRIAVTQAGYVGVGAEPATIFDVNGDSVRVRTSQTPASNGAGVQGEIAWDASYVYVCTATDTWKRAALTGGY
jgi:hypothetical protein